MKNITLKLTTCLLFSALSAETNTNPIPTGGWTLDGSLLYWNARTDGCAFAGRTKITGISGDTPQTIATRLKIESPAFDHWNPGFQIALGFVFSAKEQWRSRLAWTCFNTSTHRTVKTNSRQLFTRHLVPMLASFLTGPIADFAAIKWKLNFDTLDLDLSRVFFIGKWLALEPRVGLRAAWISQNFDTKYHAYFLTNTTVFTANTFFKDDQDFKGIGLKIGSDATFYIDNSWSILGNLSASFLGSLIHVKEWIKGLSIIDDVTAVPETVRVKNYFNRLTPTLEGSLGLQWQRFFYSNKLRFGCSALYSFSYWFKQNNAVNEFIVFTPNITEPLTQIALSDGDLQLQGLNLKFELEL
jgi:hypothetical protein